MRTFIILQPNPTPKPRWWNRAPRRHECERAILRKLEQTFEFALLRDAWRELREAP